jgi:polyisoprenoid-binding protein YceI
MGSGGFYYGEEKTMKKITYMHYAIVFLFIFSTNLYAAAPEWKIDPAHSGIYFRISHIYSTVNGFFPDFKGEVRFDPSDLKESLFSFKVKVKSINTNNSKRDGHLLSDDFFSTKKYPEMTFESKSISHKEGNQYVVEGVMKIKDVSKTIKLPFTFFGTKQHPFNPKQEVAGFEAQMTIDRLVYQVGNGKFYKMGVVGKDVDVLISLEVLREK